MSHHHVSARAFKTWTAVYAAILVLVNFSLAASLFERNWPYAALMFIVGVSLCYSWFDIRGERKATIECDNPPWRPPP